MARGPKKHLKRLNAPKHWMLDKMGGAWAPRPSTGPHKLRECLPVILILRNRLNCFPFCFPIVSLTSINPTIIYHRLLWIFFSLQTDVVTLGPKEKRFDSSAAIDRFRLLFDVKGRFVLLPISAAEAKYKLCKVVRQELTKKKIPVVVTHDGRTIRYPDPEIRVGDTVTVDIESGKITSFIKYEVGTLVMCVKGRNTGRIGYLANRERHPGSFDIVQIKDAAGNLFATREENVFVIGTAGDNYQAKVTLPKAKGIKLTILEERAKRFKDLKLA
eukprot:g3348.t1